MPNTPERFCEFQRKFNSKYQLFECAIGDWQCLTPHCAYTLKQELEHQLLGCSIANCEGQRIKKMLGDNTVSPPLRPIIMISGSLNQMALKFIFPPNPEKIP